MRGKTSQRLNFTSITSNLIDCYNLEIEDEMKCFKDGR